MGFSINKKKGVISEINVTPLVDVMLVLLIIFMVTAPMMFSGINLDLPKTKNVGKVNLNSKQVILSIAKNEDLYLGKNKLQLKNIIPEIKKIFKENQTEVVFLRADYSLPYGKVAELMSVLKKGGIKHISLVTQSEIKD